MRTTLSIDDDVLRLAQQQARRQRRSVGSVVSELARLGLQGTEPALAQEEFFGFVPLSAGDAPVTNDLVDALREELGE